MSIFSRTTTKKKGTMLPQISRIDVFVKVYSDNISFAHGDTFGLIRRSIARSLLDGSARFLQMTCETCLRGTKKESPTEKQVCSELLTGCTTPHLLPCPDRISAGCPPPPPPGVGDSRIIVNQGTEDNDVAISNRPRYMVFSLEDSRRSIILALVIHID